MQLFRVDAKFVTPSGMACMTQSSGETLETVITLLNEMKGSDIEWLEISEGCPEEENTKQFRGW